MMVGGNIRGQTRVLTTATVLEPDGGTAFILYRKDRVRCAEGQRHLKEYRLKPESPTVRLVATQWAWAAVMLVIAANEGVMPQTVEHLAICELLGIRRGITVITKADAVNGADLRRIWNR